MEIGVWTQERIWSTHVSAHMSPVICWQAAQCFPCILWLSATARSLKKNMRHNMIDKWSMHVCCGTSLIYHQIVCLVFPLAWYFLIRRSSECCAVFHFRRNKKKPCSVCHERASRESESMRLKLVAPLSFRVCCSYDGVKGKHRWCHHPPVDVLTNHLTEIWHVSAPFQWQGLSDSSVWWYQWEGGGQKKLSGLRMDYIPQHIWCIQRPYRHPSIQSEGIILIWGRCICGD